MLNEKKNQKWTASAACCGTYLRCKEPGTAAHNLDKILPLDGILVAAGGRERENWSDSCRPNGRIRGWPFDARSCRKLGITELIFECCREDMRAVGWYLLRM